MSFSDSLKCRSLLSFVEFTAETRQAGFEASDLVRGDQSKMLFSLLVKAYPDGLSNNELHRLSGIPINAVTARIVELRRVEIGVSKENLIIPLLKRDDSITSVSNVVWAVNPSYFEPSRKVV